MSDLTPRVTIDDGTLLAMASNAKFLGPFPFLASVAPAKQGRCGKCGRRADVVRTATFTSVRRALAGMSSDKKRRLKELLGTRQVELPYLDGKNKVIRLLF